MNKDSPKNLQSGLKKSDSIRNNLIKYGLFAGVLGTFLAAIQPWAMEAAISSQCKIIEGNFVYKNWKELPFPLISSFYVFNITNPEDFIRGAKLRVNEVGPFVMKQYRHKDVLDWSDDTVKYDEWKDYREAPDRSIGSFDQELVVINPIVATVGTLIKDRLSGLIPLPMALSPFVYGITSVVLMLHSESIFIKTTPRKILMGYKVNLLDTAETMLRPLAITGVKASDIIPMEDLPNNSFGLLNGKNHTPIGPWEVYTGVGVPKSLYTSAIAFKNQRVMKKWGSGECNFVQGTDGIQFEPYIERDRRLTVFAADICRKLKIVYSEDSDFRGIPTYKYKVASEEWEPPSLNPDNRCYCTHKNYPARCEYHGIMDVSGCFGGAPFVVTMPHFLGTDYKISSRVDGLKPDRKKHELYLNIKPDLGLTIDAKVRLQFNVRIEQTPFLRGFSSLQDTIVPLAWFEDSGELDDLFTNLVKYGLVFTPKALSVLFYAAALTGWSAFLLGIAYLFMKKRANSKTGSSEKLFEYSNRFESAWSPAKEIFGANSKAKKFQSKIMNNLKVPRKLSLGTSEKRLDARPNWNQSSNSSESTSSINIRTSPVGTLNYPNSMQIYGLMPIWRQALQLSPLIVDFSALENANFGHNRWESRPFSARRRISWQRESTRSEKTEAKEPLKISRAVSVREQAVQIEPELVNQGFKYAEAEEITKSHGKKIQGSKTLNVLKNMDHLSAFIDEDDRYSPIENDALSVHSMDNSKEETEPRNRSHSVFSVLTVDSVSLPVATYSVLSNPPISSIEEEVEEEVNEGRATYIKESLDEREPEDFSSEDEKEDEEKVEKVSTECVEPDEVKEASDPPLHLLPETVILNDPFPAPSRNALPHVQVIHGHKSPTFSDDFSTNSETLDTAPLQMPSRRAFRKEGHVLDSNPSCTIS